MDNKLKDRLSNFTNSLLKLITNNFTPFLPSSSNSNDSRGEDYYELLKSHPSMNILEFPDSSKQYPFKLNKFTEIETIARTRNIVNKYVHKPTGKFCAIKFVRMPYGLYKKPSYESINKQLLREVENHKMLNGHPNIVYFYGCTMNEGELLICTELMEISLTTLYQKMHSQIVGYFPTLLLGLITVDIINALEYCYSKKIMHRDIKPSNLLLSIEGVAKLCDFGESRILENSVANTFLGTLAYLPPERYKFTKPPEYDIRSDVWSLGISMVEAVRGSLPYDIPEDNFNLIGLQYLIAEANGDEIVEKNINPILYSLATIEFYKKCLKPLDERPKISDLMKKEFRIEYNAKIHGGRLNFEFLKAKKHYNILTIGPINNFFIFLNSLEASMNVKSERFNIQTISKKQVYILYDHTNSYSVTLVHLNFLPATSEIKYRLRKNASSEHKNVLEELIEDFELRFKNLAFHSIGFLKTYQKNLHAHYNRKNFTKYVMPYLAKKKQDQKSIWTTFMAYEYSYSDWDENIKEYAHMQMKIVNNFLEKYEICGVSDDMVFKLRDDQEIQNSLVLQWENLLKKIDSIQDVLVQ